jgi:hypothetical protein
MGSDKTAYFFIKLKLVTKELQLVTIKSRLLI